MFGERVRRRIYWCLDFLKGNKVYRHYRKIKRIMEHPDQVESYQREKKEQLLTFATENVEFYKRFQGKPWEEYPIINKNIVKEHWEEMKSSLANGKVYQLHTSGTTGTPFLILQDVNKRNHVLAEMIYFWGTAGYRVGMKYIYFRIWTKINRKSKFTCFCRNLIMEDIQVMDVENLERIRNRLKSNKKIGMLLGYSSTFECLAEYLLSKNDRADMFSVTVVISMAEVLKETTREKLRKVFGCKVVSLYSNQENGMLGIECGKAKEFHLNLASFYYEFLKLDREEPAEEGELCRIVITDFYNYAMPLIRYDTQDLGVVKRRAECGWDTLVVESIDGKRADLIYDTQDRPLSPWTFSVRMWKFDKVKQFQFVQNGRTEYVLRLVGAKEYYEDEEILAYIKNIIGMDANVTLEHTSHIPPCPSGKYRMVVNQYKGVDR